MTLSRTALWVAVFAVMVIVLGGRVLPGWLVALVLVAALPLAFRASLKQKRMENNFVAACWRALTKR